MTTAHTNQDRIAQVTETYYAPMVRPADTYNHTEHCSYCNKAIEIGRNTFEYVLAKLLMSNAVTGNTDIKTRHRTVEVWSIEGNNSRMTNKEGYEHQLEAYSCDHQCYILMIGIRSAYRRPVHTRLCRYILVEIDLPFNTEINLPLGTSAYRQALDIVNYLMANYKRGHTTLDYWEGPKVGLYKITYYYKRHQEALPPQPGHQRILNIVNTGTQPSVISRPVTEATGRSTVNQEAQTEGDHEVQDLPYRLRSDKGKSRDMTYWETVM